MNYEYKFPIEKPLLSEKQKINRINWCNEHKNYDWDNVIFSDEASIWLDFSGKRWVNMNCNDVNYVVKHPIKVHIWGYISINHGTKIHIFTENLTATKYLSIIKDNLPKTNGYIYQDDNDPKHRAKIITKWKNDNNIECLNWPSSSPDLNPIENIWGLMKNSIRKQQSKNMDDLKKNIISFWNNLDKDHILNTIKSMPKRLEKVINNDGGSIDY